ncbi:MAG: hypothetical protein VX899_04720 [Myxococcota bacterium]|nr:hypothetical protein [Myxococcota bacterium]
MRTTHALFGLFILIGTACTGGGMDSGWGDDTGSFGGGGGGGGGGGTCGGDFDGNVVDEGNRSHSFSVNEDREVTLTLDWDSSSDLDLHLSTASGDELTRSETDGGGTGEEISMELQAGDYVATVVQWDETDTDYELEVACD